MDKVNGKKTYLNNRGKPSFTNHSREISQTCLAIFMKNPRFMECYMIEFVKRLNQALEEKNLKQHFEIMLRNGKQLLGIGSSERFNPSGLTLNVMFKNNCSMSDEISVKETIYSVVTDFQRYLHDAWFQEHDASSVHELFVKTYIRSFNDPRYDTPFPAPNLCQRKSLLIDSTNPVTKESTDMLQFPTSFVPVKKLILSPVFCTTNQIRETDTKRNFEIVRLKLNHRARGNDIRNSSSCPAFLINVILMYHNDIEKVMYFKNKDQYHKENVAGLSLHLLSSFQRPGLSHEEETPRSSSDSSSIEER